MACIETGCRNARDQRDKIYCDLRRFSIKPSRGPWVLTINVDDCKKPACNRRRKSGSLMWCPARRFKQYSLKFIPLACFQYLGLVQYTGLGFLAQPMIHYLLLHFIYALTKYQHFPVFVVVYLLQTRMSKV